MNEHGIRTYEIATNGRTVWVNYKGIFCIARLCPSSGEVMEGVIETDSLQSISAGDLKAIHDESFDAWRDRIKKNWKGIGDSLGDIYRPKWDVEREFLIDRSGHGHHLTSHKAPIKEIEYISIDRIKDCILECWDDEVAYRPIENMHRADLDHCYRRVYRELIGTELPRDDK